MIGSVKERAGTSGESSRGGQDVCLGRLNLITDEETPHRSFLPVLLLIKNHQLCTTSTAEPISFRPISSDRPCTARMDHPYPSLHAGTLWDDPRRLVRDQLAHASVACSSG
jgi:hypothetical protein